MDECDVRHDNRKSSFQHYTFRIIDGMNHHAKSSKRQGVRTACVKPLTYLRRTTCEIGTPLPVLDSLFFWEPRSKPTRAAVRADRAAFAFLAPAIKKFCGLAFLVGGPEAVTLDEGVTRLALDASDLWVAALLLSWSIVSAAAATACIESSLVVSGATIVGALWTRVSFIRS